MLYGAAALPSRVGEVPIWLVSGMDATGRKSPIGDPNIWMWRVAWRGPEALSGGYDTDGEKGSNSIPAGTGGL